MDRDILSHVPGRVLATFRYWSDAEIAVAGTLLRELHEATRTSSLTGTEPVVCQPRPWPHNAVFRDNLPVAFIDFDTAAPGDPLEDLRYMAWTWCVSLRPDRGRVGIPAAQVRLLADSYGLASHTHMRLVDAMLDRQARNARWCTRASASQDRMAPPKNRSQRGSLGPSASTTTRRPTEPSSPPHCTEPPQKPAQGSGGKPQPRQDTALRRRERVQQSQGD
jgi:hypothetical protein